MLWREFWYSQEQNGERKPSIFKTNKTNLPRNHKTPKALKDCLAAVKSDLMDPQSRCPAKCNVTTEELKALKELIELQRSNKIVVKPCDKGGGVAIVDFEDYKKVCLGHLHGVTSDGSPYYKQVTDSRLQELQEKLQELLVEGFDNKVITKEEYEAMKPNELKKGKFYGTFKVHKEKGENKTPPIRPIVSTSGTTLENVAVFVEHHLKQLAQSHEAFIKDTPDFLREINKIRNLSENTMLVVLDVTALYTNIPPEDAVESVRNSLEGRATKEVPTEYIIRLLKIILKYNIFDFSNTTWQQIIGVSMGIKPAPSIANIFMDKNVDIVIKRLAAKYGEEGTTLTFMKRFLDDIFLVFKGTTKDLHAFFEEINQIHKNIKFTMTHTTPQAKETEPCTCKTQEAVPFLDTLCTIKEGLIVTDLYKKPTDKNQYLLTSSCHPAECVENVPYSLALRITRICSEPSSREIRFAELSEMLNDREYTPMMVEAAIAKARAVPREVALREVSRQPSTPRPVFVVRYDPRLPKIPPIVNRHWRAMVYQDIHLKEVFKEPPLIAYKRNQNLKELLVRAKLNTNNGRQKRKLKGMKKCGKCIACSFVKEGRSIKSKDTTWTINREYNCKTANVIYMLECDKHNCNQRYVGETERELKERMKEHIGYAKNNVITNATGEHFNMPGHSYQNMKFTVIEKVKHRDTIYRQEREKYHIMKFNTFHGGMNRVP